MIIIIIGKQLKCDQAGRAVIAILTGGCFVPNRSFEDQLHFEGLPARMLLINSLINRAMDFTTGSTERSQQGFLEEAVNLIQVIFC